MFAENSLVFLLIIIIIYFNLDWKRENRFGIYGYPKLRKIAHTPESRIRTQSNLEKIKISLLTAESSIPREKSKVKVISGEKVLQRQLVNIK